MLKKILRITEGVATDLILSLSIYINAGFILSRNDKLTMLNLIFGLGWIYYLFNYLIFKHLDRRYLYGKYTKKIGFAVRILMLIILYLVVGLHNF